MPGEKAGPEAIRTLVARVAPSVVSVVPYDADYNTLTEGTGFFVAEGRIVTSRHLFHGARTARVVRSDGSVHDVLGILAEDPAADIVMAAVDIRDGLAPPLAFSSASPRRGEALAVVGGRLAEGAEGLAGEAVGERLLPVLGKVLRVTCPLRPGLSGAPVVGMDGEVAGMAVVRSLPKGSLAFVVPAARVDDLSSMDFVRISDRSAPDGGLDPDRFLPAFGRLLADDIEGGLRELEAVARAADRDAEAWSAVADAHLVLGRPREAVDAARAATAMSPENADAWARLGSAFAAAGLPAEAVDACRRVVRLRPRSARAWNRLGVACYNAGLPAEAADSCKEAIRLDPDDAQEHKNLGVAYFAMGRYPEAVDAFQEAVRLRPTFDHAWKNLGMTLHLLGEGEKAVAATLEAIRIRPDYARAHNNLGVVYQGLGRTEDAIDCYQEALRIQPAFGQAWSNLAFAYVKLGRTEDAVKAYGEALARDPADADTRTALGLLLRKAGRPVEAREAFLEAVRYAPGHVAARYNLGLLLLEMGDRGAALDEYKVLKNLDAEKANRLFDRVYK